jgi:hypothetical protein
MLITAQQIPCFGAEWPNKENKLQVEMEMEMGPS